MTKIKALNRLRKRKRKRKRKQTINDAIKWLNSHEGKAAMKRAADRANKAVRYYQKAREPDWSRIHEPMTI